MDIFKLMIVFNMIFVVAVPPNLSVMNSRSSLMNLASKSDCHRGVSGESLMREADLAVDNWAKLSEVSGEETSAASLITVDDWEELSEVSGESLMEESDLAVESVVGQGEEASAASLFTVDGRESEHLTTFLLPIDKREEQVASVVSLLPVDDQEGDIAYEDMIDNSVYMGLLNKFSTQVMYDMDKISISAHQLRDLFKQFSTAGCLQEEVIETDQFQERESDENDVSQSQVGLDVNRNIWIVSDMSEVQKANMQQKSMQQKSMQKKGMQKKGYVHNSKEMLLWNVPGVQEVNVAQYMKNIYVNERLVKCQRKGGNRWIIDGLSWFSVCFDRLNDCFERILRFQQDQNLNSYESRYIFLCQYMQTLIVLRSMFHGWDVSLNILLNAGIDTPSKVINRAKDVLVLVKIHGDIAKVKMLEDLLQREKQELLQNVNQVERLIVKIQGYFEILDSYVDFFHDLTNLQQIGLNMRFITNFAYTRQLWVDHIDLFKMIINFEYSGKRPDNFNNFMDLCSTSSMQKDKFWNKYPALQVQMKKSLEENQTYIHHLFIGIRDRCI